MAAVKVTRTGTREIRGPSVGDDAVRSKVVAADLSIPAGPYAKGGYPVTARRFGLGQLRGLRGEHTDRYWFEFQYIARTVRLA